MSPVELELYFHPNEIYYPCTREYQLKVTDHPVYYCRDTAPYKYQDSLYGSVSYEIYYLYNGAIGFGYQLFPTSTMLGFHDKDLERLRILLDPDTNEPRYVFFSAHRNEGKWIPWEECETSADGRKLRVYVARGSHANYPHSGCWYRIFLLGNDNCSDRGRCIVPKLIPASFQFNAANFEEDSPVWKRLFLTKE